MIDDQHVLRFGFDGPGDALTVLRAEDERPQDQQIQRALEVRAVRAVGGGGGMMDPQWIAFATPVAIILAAGALATWIPSRRALRIDPVIVLRAQ
ncbi:MAG: hypothetical protein ACM4AI_14415 [Acidobacteriota bacterium]